MPPTPAPAPAGRPGGRGLRAWVRTHKGPAAAIGAAGGLGLILLYEHSRNAAPPAGSSTSAGPANPAHFSGQTDSSYGALEAQIRRLQAEIDKLTRARHKRPLPPPGRKPPPRKPPPRHRSFPGGAAGGPPVRRPPPRRHRHGG